MLKKEMFEKEAIKNLSTMRFVMISLIAVWALFLYGLGRYFLHLPERLSPFGKDQSPASLIMFFGQNLFEVGLLWILVHLSTVIKSISRGNPFHPFNPGRIRKIAIGVFFNAGIMFLQQIALDVILWKHYGQISNILGSLAWMIFIGAIVLMIAEAFSKGIRLQQDQDLTV